MANLVRWNPLREMQEMSDMVDRFFNDPWLRGREDDRERCWRMPMDAYATDEALVIRMELPGVKKEEVNITLEDSVLTISGEFKPREDDYNYFRRERPSGHFERVLSVGTPVDVNKAEAIFEDGVLTLTLPKTEAAKPKVIEVKKKK